MTNEDELKASAFQGLLTFRERNPTEVGKRVDAGAVCSRNSVNMPPGSP